MSSLENFVMRDFPMFSWKFLILKIKNKKYIKIGIKSIIHDFTILINQYLLTFLFIKNKQSEPIMPQALRIQS